MATATTHVSELDRGAGRVLSALTRWARRTPTATAVVAPDGAFTYCELADRVALLAGALAAAGVVPGTAVGLCLGRSRLAVPALLAVWWLGATAVPTDDRHPGERLKFVLSDADVQVIVGDALPGGVAPRRAVRLDADTLAAPAPCRNPRPEDCAYVIYTSGTTGRSKGVEVTYRALDTFLAALATVGLPSGGLGINAVSPAFDGWLWCTLLYLLHGQGVALIDLAGSSAGDDVGDDTVGDLAERIAALAPRTVCLTPSLLATCADTIPSAEVIVVAGEPCPPGLVERFAQGRRMLNVYGPTEATIAATWADSARGDDLTTIGRPLPGYRVHVLDERRRPVPLGTVGELYIGGPAVARGYRNSPELTAVRFVSDPLGGCGARMYRTGDAVVLRPDGQLEYRGRLDDQVKVRGYRVELSEVERVALQVPDLVVAAAFVTCSGDGIGLAVVLSAGVDEREFARRVRTRCAELLPEPMVPLVYVVTALPVSSAGKVDRAALAHLAVTAQPLSGRPPSTERERQVCQVWSALLPHPVQDVDASFFELGGHSLLAARAVAALRRATGQPLSMRHLLANPTVAQLARELDRLAQSTAVGGR
jgi:amino acid adenylation domain-containing protein